MSIISYALDYSNSNNNPKAQFIEEGINGFDNSKPIDIINDIIYIEIISEWVKTIRTNSTKIVE